MVLFLGVVIEVSCFWLSWFVDVVCCGFWLWFLFVIVVIGVGSCY